jgi:hypothetical protein
VDSHAAACRGEIVIRPAMQQRNLTNVPITPKTASVGAFSSVLAATGAKRRGVAAHTPEADPRPPPNPPRLYWTAVAKDRGDETRGGAYAALISAATRRPDDGDGEAGDGSPEGFVCHGRQATRDIIQSLRRENRVPAFKHNLLAPSFVWYSFLLRSGRVRCLLIPFPVSRLVSQSYVLHYENPASVRIRGCSGSIVRCRLCRRP